MAKKLKNESGASIWVGIDWNKNLPHKGFILELDDENFAHPSVASALARGVVSLVDEPAAKPPPAPVPAAEPVAVDAPQAEAQEVAASAEATKKAKKKF